MDQQHNKFADISILHGAPFIAQCTLYNHLKYRINKGTNYAVRFNRDGWYEGEIKGGLYHGKGKR
jgi:hypothetical protein